MSVWTPMTRPDPGPSRCAGFSRSESPGTTRYIAGVGERVVEETIRAGRFGRTVRLRIDLHGVSTFGPAAHHAVIRWEWITSISASEHGVTVESPKGEIVLPARAFGLEPAALAARLEEAGSIFKRPEVLEELSRSASAP